MTERPTPRQLALTYRRVGSVPAVAEELGVAYETARRWLRQADVPLQSKGQPSVMAKRLDDKEIATRYEDGESIAALGADLGVSPSTIRTRLIAVGVELRPRPGWVYPS